jgi:glycine/D-amino acid oxidase-like deaminating enzyme
VALFRDLFSSPTNRDLATSTIAMFDHVENELGHNLGLKRFGYYWMVGRETLHGLGGTLRDMDSLGSSYDVHDHSDVERMLGEGIELVPEVPEGRGPMATIDGAVFLRNAGTLSPTRLTRWYEERFRALGGIVEYGFPVDRLVPESVLGGPPRVWEEGRVSAVEGPSGRRNAKEVVVAAGVWTPALLDPVGIDSHMKAQTRQAFGLVGEGVRSLHDGNGFEKGDLPVLVLPSGGVYLKPVRSQIMLLAGCADRFGRPYGLDEDPEPEPEFLDDQIRPVLEAYIPQMSGATTRVSWAGQYHYSTIDGNPFVFKEGNLTVVAGASGSGIMKSDGIARVAAGAHDGHATVELFDGRRVSVSDMGVEGRKVQRESLII